MITQRENILKFYNHECPDYIPDFRTDVQNCNVAFVARYERPPAGMDSFDGYGVHWTFEPLANASMPSPNHKPVMDDITKWKEQVKWPDIDSFDWSSHVESDMANVDYNNYLVGTSIGHGLFERLHALMGMVEANCSLLEEPEAVKEFFDTLADYKIKLVDKICEYYPNIDMFDLSDDWGHQNGPFFSVDTWNSLFRPGMERLIKHVADKGKIFQLHSCGKWESIIPSAVEAGLQHWTSSQAMNDVYSIVVNYGKRLTMIGGCDPKEIQLPDMDLKKIKDIVGHRIDLLCKGGALIPFGNTSTPGLKQAVKECLDERKDFFQKPENRILPKI